MLLLELEADLEQLVKDYASQMSEEDMAAIIQQVMGSFSQEDIQKLVKQRKEAAEQFVAAGRQELADAEREALAPLRIRLIELLSTIGREKGFAFIYDTDTKALPFLNIDFGEDINQLVQDALK